MREILFRGKGNPKYNDGNWYEGYLTHDRDDYRISFYNDCVKMTVIAETIGQYTGLTDKNGVKIFEGDIVKAYFPNKYEFAKNELTEKIEFRNGCFWFGNWSFIEFLDKFRNYKVIGNIHDTPQMLQK